MVAGERWMTDARFVNLGQHDGLRAARYLSRLPFHPGSVDAGCQLFWPNEVQRMPGPVAREGPRDVRPVPRRVRRLGSMGRAQPFRWLAKHIMICFGGFVRTQKGYHYPCKSRNSNRHGYRPNLMMSAAPLGYPYESDPPLRMDIDIIWFPILYQSIKPLKAFHHHSMAGERCWPCA
jgi:hypothetical protein